MSADDDPRAFADAEIIIGKLNALIAKVDRLEGVLEALLAERGAGLPVGIKRGALAAKETT